MSKTVMEVGFKNEVLNLIKEAGEKGVKGKALALLFNQRDTRRIRNIIQQLRLEGHPICLGKNGGYIYSSNPADIKSTINTFLSRANELISVADSMSRAMKGEM